jgi:hypothetical protein
VPTALGIGNSLLRSANNLSRGQARKMRLRADSHSFHVENKRTAERLRVKEHPLPLCLFDVDQK